MSTGKRRLWGAMVAVAGLAACADAPSAPPVVNPKQAQLPSFSRARFGEGYAVRGDTATGWAMIRGQPREVHYEVHEGYAVWQGDIVVGRARTMPTTRAELLARPRFDVSKGVYIDDSNARWPNATVPYVIDPSLSNTSRITDGLAWIERRTAGIRFVPYTNQSDYIRFTLASGCSSDIGRQGGEQVINFDTDCTTGNAAHETLHALGMYHEQSRCDRDNYVTIFLSNVESGKEGNFDKVCSGAADFGDYDEGSIMHYGPYFFSKNGEKTLTSAIDVARDALMGQRSDLGKSDVATLHHMYGAANDAPTAVIGALAATYNEGSPVPFDASGSSDPDDADLKYIWDFGDPTCSLNPAPSICTEESPSKTYLNNGVYDVTLNVSDNLDHDIATTQVTIVNVVPTVNAGANATRNEGALFSQNGSFTDPGADTWTATVDYGDGSGEQALSLTGKTFALSHTYADNGSYTVTVRVTDSDNGTGQDQVTVTVNNVAPTVDAGAGSTVTSGQNATLTGSFSDPGVVDYPWTWSVNWGFGTNSTGSTNDQSAAIVATTRACAAGSYTPTLSVTDKDGGTGSDNMALTVTFFAVAIDITPTKSPNPVSLSKSGLLPVAILSTSTFDATQIAVATLRLGNEVGTDTPVAKQTKGTYQSKFEDVNKDGRLDLVVMFDTKALITNGDVVAGATSLAMRGFQGDGCTNFRGTDSIVVVP